jgi:hypothetical protein
MIWDRSGSMSPLQTDAIGAFNTFIKQQKDLKAKTSVVFSMFDEKYEIVYDNVDISEVKDLDNKTYFARGWTALLDAVGKTVTTYKASNNKNEKTIVVIMTDGEENSSREYSYKQIKDLLTEVQDKLGWEVNFLGANIDSFATGASLGTHSANNANIDFTSKGYADAALTMMFKTSMTRGVSAAATLNTISGHDDLKSKVNLDKLDGSLNDAYQELSRATTKDD